MIYTPCVLAALFSVACMTLASAKRAAPEEVAPVSRDGIEYCAPRSADKIGQVQARDAESKKVLWEATIYEIEYDPDLEKDVQWVFISGLNIEGESLIITDERNKRYALDLKTREVRELNRLKPLDKTDNASQPETADRMEWFRDAKFGMMIHWGIYSTRGGIAPDGRPQKAKYTEWYQSANKLPYVEYSKLAKEFNPVDFDAEQWVLIAKKAGMKYITITSKHHDGFCLFDSAYTEYDIMDATPFKRDVLMELREACDKHGLKLCYYYSHAQDWEQYDAWHTPRSAFPEKQGTPVDHERYLTGKALPQVEELCTRYRPDGFWFDTPWFNKERKIPNLSISKRFNEIVRKHRPSAVINSRISYGAIAGTKNLDTSLFDYLSLKDQGIPTGKLPLYAESPDSIHHSYGYDARPDMHYRSAEELLGRMARVIAGNGNYLLNVGPTGKGKIPAPAVKELEVIGSWMNANAEAVYGTNASPFPLGKDSVPVTTKGKRLYVFAQTGQGPATLPRLASRVVGAWVLASSAKVDVEQREKEVVLTLPKDDESFMPVIVVECENNALISK